MIKCPRGIGVIRVWWVGTSGWMYDDWRSRFYPAGLPKRLWLEHYATAYNTVEINNAFYRLPERDTFTNWRKRVVTAQINIPSGTHESFRFAVKISRYLTHIRRLKDPEEPVERFTSRVTALGDRLGPVLMQLPPTLSADAGLLDAALTLLPMNVAVELRHPSWWSRPVRQVLERRGAALVWADRLGRPVTPLWRTADWGYLRLHEGRAHPRPSYGRTALRSWHDRLTAEFAPEDDVYVYFNNDPGAAAIRNADTFRRLATSDGIPMPVPGESGLRTAGSGIPDGRPILGRRETVLTQRLGG
jgi:uncharacterized protein YecE (DUF72 family)